jgi:hypothetical protein
MPCQESLRNEGFFELLPSPLMCSVLGPRAGPKNVFSQTEYDTWVSHEYTGPAFTLRGILMKIGYARVSNKDPLLLAGVPLWPWRGRAVQEADFTMILWLSLIVGPSGCYRAVVI